MERRARRPGLIESKTHTVFRGVAGQHLFPAGFGGQRQVLADALADGQQAIAHRLG